MNAFNREDQIEMHKTLQWMNPNIQFVFRKNIVEYDMQSASLSVSRRFHLLDDAVIDTYERMTKDKRTKAIGLIQRDDKVFSENMINGVLQTRKEFLEMNHLNDSNIISLHSDAIIFIQTDNVIDHIETVPFIRKNTWTGYIRYQKLEMFYSDGIVEYKGIPKQMLQQHTLGICQHIRTIFDKLDQCDESIYPYLTKFQKKYLQDKLPEYYYIPFGNTGKYKSENLKLLSFLAQVVMHEMR